MASAHVSSVLEMWGLLCELRWMDVRILTSKWHRAVPSTRVDGSLGEPWVSAEGEGIIAVGAVGPPSVCPSVLFNRKGASCLR